MSELVIRTSGESKIGYLYVNGGDKPIILTETEMIKLRSALSDGCDGIAAQHLITRY